jgi:formamidopyrimidine-DNA glycosylase
MPELPEVEALAVFLRKECSGQTIQRAEVGALSALKTYQPPLESVVGQQIDDVGRRGKYLTFEVGSVWLVLHLARGGWVHWKERLPVGLVRPGKGPLALRIGLSGGSGFDVTEQGTEKRLALWVVNDLGNVEGIARLGPDPLEPGFAVDDLAGVLEGQSGNLKTVLTDQSVLAGVGNAYSDEALHAAKLSPYKTAGKLSEDEIARLYTALVGVLEDAVERSVGLAASGLKSEKKSGMAVHGRAGQPCPVCGDIVREVSFATKSLQYCPTCQTGGKPLADRRMSRLLK